MNEMWWAMINDKIDFERDMTGNDRIKENCPLSGLTYKIIKCAEEVYKLLGNHFQEIIYHDALSIEFELHNIPFDREFESPLYYKGEMIGTRCIDFFVNDKVMVQIEALIQLEDVHQAQAINYLTAYNMEVGLLINFGSQSLDIKLVMNTKYQNNHKLEKHG